MVKKQFLKGKPQVKVTFYLPESITGDSAAVAGDFNDWNPTATPMEKLKDGRYKATVTLATGRDYAYRYYVDGQWHNDWDADKYAPNEFGEENSVVVAQEA